MSKDVDDVSEDDDATFFFAGCSEAEGDSFLLLESVNDDGVEDVDGADAVDGFNGDEVDNVDGVDNEDDEEGREG